jgi:hypothetical protein
MPYRTTFLMQITTAPPDLNDAGAHIAGWSESHWSATAPDPASRGFGNLMRRRAALLPVQGRIVGYRIASYTFTGNRMLPGPVTTGHSQATGGSGQVTDVPQMALDCSTATAGGNSSRFSLRGIPDSCVSGGEYNPLLTFKVALDSYFTLLVSQGYGLAGRDLTQPSFKVKSIANGILTTDGTVTLFPGVDYVRFRGVRDINGVAVSGAYQLGTSPAANQFLLQGFNTTIAVNNSGSARRDLINFYAYTEVSPARITVRKVGRPFEQYRGRRSRRRMR